MFGKGKVFPIVITVIIIVIIVYLFATVEQPLVVCNRKVADDLGITISEELDATIDGKKIKSMVLVKTISLPEEYKNNRESIEFSLEKAYEYLGEKANVTTIGDNKLLVKARLDNDETIILNNIEFFDNDGLSIKINSNTKSSGVVTLKVGDNYTEGELMTRLKNNGYSCK